VQFFASHSSGIKGVITGVAAHCLRHQITPKFEPATHNVVLGIGLVLCALK